MPSSFHHGQPVTVVPHPAAGSAYDGWFVAANVDADGRASDGMAVLRVPYARAGTGSTLQTVPFGRIWPRESYGGEAAAIRADYARDDVDTVRTRVNWGERNAAYTLETHLARAILDAATSSDRTAANRLAEGIGA